MKMKLAFLCVSAVLMTGLCAGEIIERRTINADRMDVHWYPWAKQVDKDNGHYVCCGGWAEFDFDIKNGGWYEFLVAGTVCGWARDCWLDGKLYRNNYTTDEIKTGVYLESPRFRKIKELGYLAHCPYTKEFNIFLTKGKHTIRIRRTQFPGCLPIAVRLQESCGNPMGSVYTVIDNNVIRTSDTLNITIQGGTSVPTKYELVADGVDRNKSFLIGTVEFPATKKVIEKNISLRIPQEGVYKIFAKLPTGEFSKPCDLSAPTVVVIDTKPAPAGTDLYRKLVVDIDCVNTNPYKVRDGGTKVVKKPFGAYRESSGNASNKDHWGLDGFSYKFKLPDRDHIYQLVVDYPDDDFRSIGFWTNDNVKCGDGGVICTGGVETGGQYRVTNKMVTHTAFFYPRSTDIVFAAINLNQGSKAAASRIRVYQVRGDLPDGTAKMQRGRLSGEFFEEPGRWNRFFGQERGEYLAPIMRWANWNRFVGKNLMHPGIMCYLNIHYPSKILTGSHVATVNTMRVFALTAEKYNQKFIPHLAIHCDGNLAPEFGVTTKKVKDAKGKEKEEVVYLKPGARDLLSCDKNGKFSGAWTTFAFNALHPTVQAKYLDIIGEAADMLADCSSFEGISMRVALGWQYSGINAMFPNRGFDDWTIAQFEKDTGIKVPGNPEDPKRFMVRHNFLKGEKKGEWQKWMCGRILDYYRRIRDRIRQARPGAGLYIVWWGSPKDMINCGINLDAFSKEDGITFICSGGTYGRRHTTPLGVAGQAGGLTEDSMYTAMNNGKRTFTMNGAYYEVNSNLDWGELGGAKYNAFDSCNAGGVNELQLYATAVAQGEAGVLTGGGNGWIFGTPDLIRPFLQEFTSLPSEKFETLPGLNDPVVFRQLKHKDGLYFYAVNRIDQPVKVKFEAKGKVLSAVDGKPAKTEFVLEPFMLKGFLIRKSAFSSPKIISAKSMPDPALYKALKDKVEFAKNLRTMIQKREAAVEFDKALVNEVIATLDRVISDYEKGAIWFPSEGLRRKTLSRVYEMTGHSPPGQFAASQPRGGFLPNDAAMPKLSLSKIFGGEPDHKPLSSISLKHGDKEYRVCKDSTGTYVQVWSLAGKYLQTYHLTDINHTRDLCTGGVAMGGSWHLPDPHPVNTEWAAIENNALYTCSEGKHICKFDISDSFRQIPVELVCKVKFTERMNKNKESDLVLKGLTQMRFYKDKIMYLSGNVLYAIDPKTDAVSVFADFSKTFAQFLSFDFAANGDLYLGSHYSGKRGRGVSLWMAKKTEKGYDAPVDMNNGKPLFDCPYFATYDLIVEKDNSVLLRYSPWMHIVLHRWKDGKAVPFFDAGNHSHLVGEQYGLFRCPDGSTLVAGGNTRNIFCVKPNGKIAWSYKFNPQQQPPCLPVRDASAITMDGRGRVWVADAGGDKLICLTNNGKYLGTYGHTSTADDKSGTGFYKISGLAAYGDFLYIADAGNNRIIKLNIQK